LFFCIFRDLEKLTPYKTRSPYSDTIDNAPKITVYRRRDVENRYTEGID